MIATRMQLFCDGLPGEPLHREAHFPSDGAVNATMVTQQELRTAAKTIGWTRQRGNPPRDLCPECSAQYVKVPHGR